MPIPGLVGIMPAPLTAQITAGSVISASASNGAQTYGSSTVLALGGAPAYSYDWERVSGDVAISATSDTAATTTWSSTGTDISYSAIWRCKVTDAAGTVVYSDTVNISVTHGTPP